MTTEKELGEALKEGRDTIKIECDLAKHVIKIKATNRIAWLVAVGAIMVALAAVLSGPVAAPVVAPAELVAGTAAVSILGPTTAAVCVSIAIAAGSVGSLNKLRDYDLIKVSDSEVILKKKKAKKSSSCHK